MQSKNAEYQKTYRERNNKIGRKEIRGIMATNAEQELIKPIIRKMLVNMRNGAE